MFFIDAMFLADARIPEKVNCDDTFQQEERNVLRMHTCIKFAHIADKRIWLEAIKRINFSID